MEMDILNTKTSEQPVRVDKALEWFEKSRDSWKEKAKDAKDSLKKQKLAVKRARVHREELRKELLQEKTAHHEALEQLSQKDTEIEELKVRLEKAELNLKKK